MTGEQKELSLLLLRGGYLMKAQNHNNKTVFKVYSEAGKLEKYVFERSVGKSLAGCLKRDRKSHRYTLNLTAVRQQHGRTFIKASYNKLRKQKAADTQGNK